MSLLEGEKHDCLFYKLGLVLLSPLGESALSHWWPLFLLTPESNEMSLLLNLTVL